MAVVLVSDTTVVQPSAPCPSLLSSPLANHWSFPPLSVFLSLSPSYTHTVTSLGRGRSGGWGGDRAITDQRPLMFGEKTLPSAEPPLTRRWDGGGVRGPDNKVDCWKMISLIESAREDDETLMKTLHFSLCFFASEARQWAIIRKGNILDDTTRKHENNNNENQWRNNISEVKMFQWKDWIFSMQMVVEGSSGNHMLSWSWIHNFTHRTVTNYVDTRFMKSRFKMIMPTQTNNNKQKISKLVRGRRECTKSFLTVN